MAGRPKNQSNNGDTSAISLKKNPEIEMLSNIYVDKATGKVDPRYNRAFVVDQWRRATIAKLPTLKLDEVHQLVDEMFNMQLELDRDKKAAAAQAVLDKAADDPELLAALEARIAEIKAIHDSRISDRGRGARQTVLAG
jgi:hypothetical protein